MATLKLSLLIYISLFLLVDFIINISFRHFCNKECPTWTVVYPNSNYIIVQFYITWHSLCIIKLQHFFANILSIYAAKVHTVLFMKKKLFFNVSQQQK